MEIYSTKIAKLSGTDSKEVGRKARMIFKTIATKTKRKPYIRSAFFNREKIFLDYFWSHIENMPGRDRARRLKFYPCALDLLAFSRIRCTVKINPNRLSERLYRFLGKTNGGELFAVQVKEDLKRKEKHFISVFPFEQ